MSAIDPGCYPTDTVRKKRGTPFSRVTSPCIPWKTHIPVSEDEAPRVKVRLNTEAVFRLRANDGCPACLIPPPFVPHYTSNLRSVVSGPEYQESIESKLSTFLHPSGWS
jgi:hypothetical protein